MTVIKLKIHKIRPEIKEYRDLSQARIFSIAGSICTAYTQGAQYSLYTKVYCTAYTQGTPHSVYTKLDCTDCTTT